MATQKKRVPIPATTASLRARVEEKQVPRKSAEDETSQLIVRIPLQLHKRIKKHCVDRNMSIRDYILELLRLDGMR